LILRKQLKNLKIRKESLRDLIGNTQKDYFQFGKMSEREYEIRTRNFAEMIRDIDRQIPLVEEKLVKYGKTREGKRVEEEVKKKEKKREDKIDKESKKDLKKDLKKRFKKERRKEKILSKKKKTKYLKK